MIIFTHPFPREHSASRTKSALLGAEEKSGFDSFWLGWILSFFFVLLLLMSKFSFRLFWVSFLFVMMRKGSVLVFYCSWSAHGGRCSDIFAKLGLMKALRLNREIMRKSFRRLFLVGFEGVSRKYNGITFCRLDVSLTCCWRGFLCILRDKFFFQHLDHDCIILTNFLNVIFHKYKYSKYFKVTVRQ